MSIAGCNPQAGPAKGLADGDYQWWARDWAASGEGNMPWMPVQSFSITRRAPGGVEPIAPAGSIEPWAFTFRWRFEPAATGYRLWVAGAEGRIHDACTGPRM